MPKELKELKTFIKGTVSTMSPEDIPDEAASYSLDLDNTSELGKLQGRYEDWNYKADHLYAHHYADISRFTIGVDIKPYRDLIFVKIVSGTRPAGTTIESGGSTGRWTVDNATSPFLSEIGVLPKWIDGGGVEQIQLVENSTNGDIAMQGSGKAMHIGFGGDSSVTAPKWVGHFGHERFDYVWDTTYPYIEEDWISVENVIKEFDIIIHSYEDAHIYDEAYAEGAETHNYITAGRLSGAGLIKIDISTAVPTIVASSSQNYNGLTAATQAWNKWGTTTYQTSDNTFVKSLNAFVDDSGNTDSEDFTGGVGGWSASSGVIEEGVSTNADQAKLINHGSNGTCIITHKITVKKGDHYTLEIDHLALHANTTKLDWQVGTTIGGSGDEEFSWETITTSATGTKLDRRTNLLNADELLPAQYNHQSNQFIVTSEDASNKYFDLYITIRISGDNSAVSYMDGIRLIPVCNNVGDSSKIDGYWLHHGGYEGSSFVYGRIAKLNPKLEFEYSRVIEGWGHDWQGNPLAWHDGKTLSETYGYCSQILQCGEKLWFSIKTDTQRAGFVAAHAKQIQLHDCPVWSTTSGGQDEIEHTDEQYLHGQIGLLYNTDIPDPYDGNSVIRPDNRTPDSSLGCNNVETGIGSIGPVMLIPRVEHPGRATLYEDGKQKYSNQVRTNEDVYDYGRYQHWQAAISHVSWIAGDWAHYNAGSNETAMMRRSIAYKTYQNSMARIPDSKTGVNWFFSAGSVEAGNLRDNGVGGYGNFIGSDVKVAGYSIHPRFRGRNASGTTSAEPYTDIDTQTYNISLHYLATVGPRYRNAHRAIHMHNTYNKYLQWGNISGDQLEGVVGFLDEKFEMDNLGHQWHSGNTGGTRRVNLQELLGGYSMLESTTSGICQECKRSGTGTARMGKYSASGSVWKNWVHTDFEEMFYGNTNGKNAAAAAAEYYRAHGFEDLCSIAPVYLCLGELPEFHNSLVGGGGNVKFKGSESGSNPTAKYLENVAPDKLDAQGHVGSTSWEEMRQTNEYSNSFDIDTGATNILTYPDDHYEDILGIEMVPYLNHKNNIVRGNGNSGWIQDDYRTNGGPYTSASAYWQGGVKLIVAVSNSGVMSYRAPNGPNCYGGGAPNIINMCDANSDGWAGGTGSNGTYAFWDLIRLQRPLEDDTDKHLWGRNKTSNTHADHLANYSFGHFSKGSERAYSAYSYPSPYCPAFIYGYNGFDVLGVPGSWGDSMDPVGPIPNIIGSDIHGNQNYTWSSVDVVGDYNEINDAVGASPFTIHQRGWSGQYFNGLELWGRKTLGASGDATETNTGYEGNIAQGTGANKFSSYSPVFQSRGFQKDWILYTGNILKPHTTIEAENGDNNDGYPKANPLGALDTGNNVPPGFSLSSPGSWDDTNPTFEDLDHFVQKKVANTDGAELVVSDSSVPSNGVFSDEKYYLYKLAFLYDGNQETPLSKATYPPSPLQNGNFRDYKVRLQENVIPRRVSHITIYRAESTTNNEEDRDGSYRLIKQIPLTRGPADNPNGYIIEDNGNTTEVYPGFKINENSGWYEYQIDSGVADIRDTGNVGMSYQAINGMPETIEDFRVFYGLSTQLNNEHFIGRCWRPELEGGERFIIKSKPGKFSTFNWVDDWLRLPTVPTALQAYRGRLYAFDESNMYRIDPTLMRIEDILEGVGCISPKTITATDFGMIFCDKNNIYLHDGQKATPIGGPILKNVSHDEALIAGNERADDGYHAISKNAIKNTLWGSPKIWTSWSGYAGSFLVCITSSLRGTPRTYIYAYKPEFKRWDKWSIHGDGSEISSMFLGPDGETYFGATGLDGTHSSGLYRLLGMKDQYTIQDGLRRPWKFDSKGLNMGRDTQKKKLKNVKVLSSKNLAESDSDFLKVYLDGKESVLNIESTNLSEAATIYEKTYLTKLTLAKDNKYGSNLISNSNFESDDIGSPPATWAAANQAELSVVEGGHSGNCMKLLQTLSAIPIALVSNLATVIGKQYIFTFWHKDIDETGMVPSYTITDQLTISAQSPISSTDWVKEEFRFTATSEETDIYFIHNAGANVGDDGHDEGTAFYFDDISLVEVEHEITDPQSSDFYSMRVRIDADNDTKVESFASIFRRKSIK